MFLHILFRGMMRAKGCNNNRGDAGVLIFHFFNPPESCAPSQPLWGWRWFFTKWRENQQPEVSSEPFEELIKSVVPRLSTALVSEFQSRMWSLRSWGLTQSNPSYWKNQRRLGRKVRTERPTSEEITEDSNRIPLIRKTRRDWEY